MYRAISLMLLLFLAIIHNATAQGSSAPANDRDTVRRAVTATVQIIAGEIDRASGEFRGESSGSGVIISSSGLVLSARHVVFLAKERPARELWARLVDPAKPNLPPDIIRRLKILAVDDELDLALLRIERKSGETDPATYPFLRVSSGDDLTYGSVIRLVGFPGAGGATTTVNSVSVVGFDANEGWIKVEGTMMHGVSGGGAINERGELVGVPLRVESDQVPFFGENDLPIGVIILGKVGFIRSHEKLTRFLAQHPTFTQGLFEQSAGVLEISGTITDQETGEGINGAVIGVLTSAAAAPEAYVSRKELIAYAKSSAKGSFRLNRGIKSGRYWVKVVHEDYKVFLRQLDLKPEYTSIDVKLRRE